MKRIKLEYDDIGASATQNMVVWDMIINKEARKVDSQILTQAIRQGNVGHRKLTYLQTNLRYLFSKITIIFLVLYYFVCEVVDF